MKKKLIAPSILSADFARLADELKRLENAGADWVHVDVMDGHFVPNLTIGAPVVAALKSVTQLPLDVHLMISEPDKYIQDFAKAGASVITVHIEALKDPEKTLKDIKNLGARVGLSLRPKTPLSEIKKWMPFIDLVLVMTVEPGFGGQSFMDSQISKVNELSQWKSEYNFLIEVDGGINDRTIQKIPEADIIVAGNYIFKHANMSHAVQILRGQSGVANV